MLAKKKQSGILLRKIPRPGETDQKGKPHLKHKRVGVVTWATQKRTYKREGRKGGRGRVEGRALRLIQTYLGGGESDHSARGTAQKA